MVFRRTRSRDRFFFVQYEARIPIFTRDGKINRRVKMARYFREQGQQFCLKDKAIYVVVLTQPVALSGAVIEGVQHPACITGKCAGVKLRSAEAVVQRLGRKVLEHHLQSDAVVRRLLSRFPSLRGQNFRLAE
jgi:hypothetical protein